MSQTTPTGGAVRRPGPFTRRMIRVGGALHNFVYRRGIGRKMGKLPLILLTTRGRKTGRPHTVPLGAICEGDGWVVIGSFGGLDVDPAWWMNLMANPEASIQVDNRSVQVRMQQITDPAERQRIWRNVVAANPGYDGYTKKTSRVIPLGLLRPV